MMAVTHLLSSSEFHGAESMVLELCRGQIRDGVNASVVLFRGSAASITEIRDRFEGAGVPVDVLDVDGRVDFGAARQLRSLLIERPAQILHSHKYKTTPYALYAVRGTAAKVVATFHNWLYESRLLSLYARFDKYLATFCGACVAVSRPVADELAHHVERQRIILVRNGVDTTRWHPAVNADTERGSRPFVVGFVGRISAPKGVADLLEAISRLPDVNGRPVHGLFVGEGELAAELESRAARPGLAGRVVFTGALTDVADAYRRMDLIALPSRNEGCPMVLLEAMAMAIPAVANDVGDVSLLVRDWTTGRLLHDYGSGPLVEAIRDLLQDDERRRAMGDAARALICAEFSTEVMVKAYESVYRKILDEPE